MSMEQKRFHDLVADFEMKIEKAIAKERYNDALELAYMGASFLYTTNQCYINDTLEASIHTIANAVIKKSEKVDKNALEQDTVLFYDGVGLEYRGLSHIYVDALVQNFKVCYVTYADRKEYVLELISIVKESGGTVFFINRDRPVRMVKQLNEILSISRAGKFVFYSYSFDVVAPTLMSAYEGVLMRYQINLTDHGFWLGVHATDKHIEFRDYGASITSEYRGVPKEKIVKLPFYPTFDKDREFEGYPFPLKDGQKVVFSGGSLYKTLGEGNKYYEIVDYILDKHDNVIFWYAGAGDDSELNKCMARHPGRVYHTEERKDLHQVLQHVCFYLSTYPICGGLMYQFAATAGVVPVTLRRDDDNSGFLLNQESLNVDFDTMDALEQEIDRILTDEHYRQARGRRMQEAVISKDAFSSQLRSIMTTGESAQEIQYRHIDTENFRRNYLEIFTERDLALLFAQKKEFFVMLRYFPVLSVKGAFLKILRKLTGK